MKHVFYINDKSIVSIHYRWLTPFDVNDIKEYELLKANEFYKNIEDKRPYKFHLGSIEFITEVKSLSQKELDKIQDEINLLRTKTEETTQTIQEAYEDYYC